MADISKEINDFREARYGEEVRGSMISLAEKINGEVEQNTTNVNRAATTANQAATTANQAAEDAQTAINEANQTLEEAQEAKTAAAGSASGAANSAQTAAESASLAAEAAATAEDIAAGLGGFNGSATSVSSSDPNGLGSANVQGQLDILGAPEFEDFTDNETEVPDAREAISSLVSGQTVKNFFSKTKAALMGLVTLGEMRQLLINNGLTTEAGKYFLDAAYGKTLADGLTQVNSDLTVLNTNKADATDVDAIWTDLDPIKSSSVDNADTNTAGKVNIVTWGPDTYSTPYKTGNTIYGNGFLLTYSTGSEWLCQLAMAVGDSNLFTRYKRSGEWSGWTTLGSAS